MSRPLGRVLALLELLQAARAGTTVGDLAGRLGVDERTVRRYAAHLVDLGIPIETRRGRYGGLRLASGYKLPPLMLTDDEALSVVLGLVSVRRTGLAVEGAAGESALAKIQRVLPQALRARTDALLATLGFALPARAAHEVAGDTVLTLASAARLRQPVSFQYTKRDSDPHERRLDPYGLVFHGGKWFVTGKDHARSAVRTFRLDRIEQVCALPGTFDVPTGFDPGAHVAAGLASGPWAHEVRVLLRTSHTQARRRIPPTVAALTEVEGGVRMIARVEHLDGMAQMLAGLGWDFEVEHPAELRDAVRLLGERLLHLARGSPSPDIAPSARSARDGAVRLTGDE